MLLLDVMKYANFVGDVTITMLNEGKRSAEVCPKPEVFFVVPMFVPRGLEK